VKSLLRHRLENSRKTHLANTTAQVTESEQYEQPSSGNFTSTAEILQTQQPSSGNLAAGVQNQETSNTGRSPLNNALDAKPVTTGRNAFSWKEYLAWIKQTLKTPTQNNQFNSTLFPWITIAAISLTAALSLTLRLYFMFDDVKKSSLGAFGSLVGLQVSNPVNIGVFFALFAVFAGLFITVTFSTWVGLKILKDTASFTDVLGKYASLYIPITVVFLFAGLLSLVQLGSLGFFFIVIALCVVQLSTSYILFTATSRLRLDDFYAKMLAIFASQAILAIITIVPFAILGVTVLSNVIGSFI
jgi:hypothetical protein